MGSREFEVKRTFEEREFLERLVALRDRNDPEDRLVAVPLEGLSLVAVASAISAHYQLANPKENNS